MTARSPEGLGPILTEFMRLFGEVQPPDAVRLFGGAASRSLANHTARAAVARLRGIAGNQSTEDASTAVATFLSEPGGFGAAAIDALAVFAACDAETLEPIVAAQLPSTLVKAIYLFYDLPSSTAENRLMWDRMRASLARCALRPPQLTPAGRRHVW